MRFPTGGTAREPYGMIRCDSGADSIVWMEETFAQFLLRETVGICMYKALSISQGFFTFQEIFSYKVKAPRGRNRVVSGLFILCAGTGERDDGSGIYAKSN